MPKTPDPDKPPPPPIPPWAWVFVVACVAIPVITLGGVIPAMIGGGGAAGSVAVARKPDLPLAGRLAACVGITAVCWVVFLVVLGGFAMVMQRG